MKKMNYDQQSELEEERPSELELVPTQKESV